MKSYLVLGLGRFGMSVAQTIYNLGHEVVGVDESEKLVNEFSRLITHTIQADITDEDFLKAMDISKFDSVVVAVGSNLQVSIMVTVLLKELSARYILVKAQDDFQAKILYKVGADKVILPEQDMGIKVAHNLMSDSFFELIEISQDYSITSVNAPESWCGKTLGELAVRSKYGINILAIKEKDHTNVVPNAKTMIGSDTVITILGMNHDLKKFQSVR